MYLNNIHEICECGKDATTPSVCGWFVFEDGRNEPSIEWWCDDCMAVGLQTIIEDSGGDAQELATAQQEEVRHAWEVVRRERLRVERQGVERQHSGIHEDEDAQEVVEDAQEVVEDPTN